MYLKNKQAVIFYILDDNLPIVEGLIGAPIIIQRKPLFQKIKNYMVGIHVGFDETVDQYIGTGFNVPTIEWITKQMMNTE